MRLKTNGTGEDDAIGYYFTPCYTQYFGQFEIDIKP